MTLPLCPECDKSGGMYYAGTWCAYCGWHGANQTTAHENFSRDDKCRWCSRD